MEDIRKLVASNLLSILCEFDDPVLVDERNFNVFIDELFDLEKKEVYPLGEKSTLVFRKEVGLFDNGTKQDITQIATFLGEKKSRVVDLMEYGYSFLPMRLEVNNHKPICKMSSAIVNPDFKNDSIYNLGLPSRVLKRLEKNNIFTLRDLLCFNKADLNNMWITKTSFDLIANVIHSLGLKFYDELTPQERAFVVASSTEEEINNSSIGWICHIYDLLRNRAGKYSVGSIEDLKTFLIIHPIKECDAVLAKAAELGINLINDMALKYDSDISILGFSDDLVSFLKSQGILSVRDLTHRQMSFYRENDYLSEYDINFIFQAVHGVGLSFVDEVKPIVMNRGEDNKVIIPSINLTPSSVKSGYQSGSGYSIRKLRGKNYD